MKDVIKLLNNAVKDENEARQFYTDLTHELFDKVDSLRSYGLHDAADRVEEFARIANETRKQETEHGIAMFNIKTALEGMMR
ncbi:MAG: hypothetical protein V1701_02965 [Planctomycetota bacterium]